MTDLKDIKSSEMDINSMLNVLDDIVDEQVANDEAEHQLVYEKMQQNNNPLAALPRQKNQSLSIHSALVNSEQERLSKINRVKPKQNFLTSKIKKKQKRLKKKNKNKAEAYADKRSVSQRMKKKRQKRRNKAF
mgnify:CR=1 FL=1